MVVKETQVVQLTASSRRENGGAYGGDVFGGKWVVSKGDLSNYLFCVVVWSVLVNDEFWVQLEKSTPLPSPAVGEVLKPVGLQPEAGIDKSLALERKIESRKR